MHGSTTMRGYSRKIASNMTWMLSLGALLLVVIVVLDILITVVRQGAGVISLSLFTTQTTGIAGGLQNAILGTLDLIFFSTLFAGPVGIMGGIYLAVFAPDRIARTLRFVAEVLAGIPSIVIGYFGYTMMVQAFGWGFSVLAGSISLSILTLPYIVRTTEASIRQVPKSYYEGALALGLTPFSALRTVVMRPATPGIVTGLLLAISIGLGETAPLIYTAGWSNFNPTLHLTKNPIGYLTYVVWTYLNEPYSSAHRLAYTAALLLIILVVILHLLARFLQPRVKG